MTDRQSSKENNSESINARVMVLAFCMWSTLINIYMKFCEDCLNGFQVIEHTQFCDRQMPGEKQYVALALRAET